MFIRSALLVLGLSLTLPAIVHAQADLPTPESHKAQLIDGRYVIDVRTPGEWKQDHIEGATLVPYDQIGQKIAALGLDKNAPIGVFCKSGGRAETAKNSLQALGYQNVVNLGGIADARSKLHVGGEVRAAR